MNDRSCKGRTHLDDFGGRDVVLAGDPADLPVSLDEVAQALGAEGGVDEAAAMWILGGLERADDPLIISSTIELLVPAAAASEAFAEALAAQLLARAADRNDARAGYIAGEALDAVANVLLAGCASRFRMDYALLLRDAGTDVDQAFALRASIAASVAFAHWPEPLLREALVTGLERLADHPEAGTDAIVELGHVKLVEAVEADDRAGLVTGLLKAGALFERAAGEQEDRVDAQFLACAVAGLLRFLTGETSEAVAAESERARGYLGERGLYGRQDALPALSRRAEEATWMALLDQLAAVRDLDAPAWTHGARVVTSAMEAVRLSRAVRLNPFSETDIAPAVIPRIDAPFIRHQHQLLTLQAVLDNEDLDDEIRREGELILARATDPPKDHGDEGPLERVLGPKDAAALEAVLKPEPALQARIVDMLGAALLDHVDRDAQWIEVYERAVEAFEGSPDFIGAHRLRIEKIVAYLIDFVSFCLRYELRFDPAMEYLGRADAHEKDMANHLALFLKRSGGVVDLEVRHEGMGGRTDIQIRLKADRFVIECKRDNSPVATGALDPYLAQTELYLTTSLRIGALAVLDLSDKSKGQVRGLDARVWVADRPSDGTASVRHVLCLLVPGNRKSTPSARSKARKS